MREVGFERFDEIGPDLSQGLVVIDVERRQTLAKLRFIARLKGPLREVVREALGQEMVLFEALKRVIEN
jgi:hypothetical protein